MLSYRCLQMEWWAAVTAVAIPSQPALLMRPYFSSARQSVLSPRASRAILHSRHPADCILPILVRKLAVGTATRKRVQNKWSSTGETADAADSALQTVDLCFNWNNKCLTWFLDQDIPSHPRGGYVRILEESLRWEERLGKTRIKPTDGLPICCWLSRTGGGNSRAVVGTFYENDCWTENKSRSQSSRRKLSARKKRKKQGIDHQHGQYCEHCKRSTQPRDS